MWLILSRSMANSEFVSGILPMQGVSAAALVPGVQTT
jgi:hypothetical protein